MFDWEVKEYLDNLKDQIRNGGPDGNGQPLTTEQLRTVLQLVNDGQLNPKKYPVYHKNSEQAKNSAYELTSSDLDNYERLNPQNAKDAIEVARDYIQDEKPIPDHLLNKIGEFRSSGDISEDDYRRIDKYSQKFEEHKEKKGKDMADTTTPTTSATTTSVPTGSTSTETTDTRVTSTPDTSETSGAATPLVQIGLSEILTRLHLSGQKAVAASTNNKVAVKNEAYNEESKTFNVTPGVYKITASLTTKSNALMRYFRASTARKALLTYLNHFIGPQLSIKFKNAALYKPTTNNGNDVRGGFFGRLINRDRSAVNLGARDSVKDVTNGVVSYWMKYRLMNSETTSECWIKFAESGKPLLTESNEVPCEENGWCKLNEVQLSRMFIESSTIKNGGDTENFVRDVECGNNEMAALHLRKILESKVSERLSRCFAQKQDN